MYMGQSRRFVFDLGGEVTVRRGQVGHPDYADGGTAALQTGLAMWNEDPGSNIRFVYGGVGGEPDCGDPGDFFAAGVADTVIFEDPCGGIEEDWIRAMTGIILEGSGPFDGDLWDIVVGSIIVFNEGHDISESLFESLMAHELGHVVAFAHHTGEPALMNDVNQDGAVLRGLDRVCAAHLYPHPASDVGLDFSWSPDAPRGGESVTFSATAPVDPDGWRWWFSDGSVFEGRQVVRRFANAGTVSVALTIEEGEAQAQRTHAVEVIEPSTGVVAAVANTPGVGDTDWHTDLVLVNRSDETAGGSFECRSRTGEICGSMDYEIPPGHLHVVDNVLASLGDEQNGSLLVLPATDAMSLSASRTYTASPTGSYGQAIPGMNAVGPGTFFIPSVRWNDAFRTNIGIASAADVPIRLHLELHVGPDESVTATRSVPPFAWRQWRLTDLFGGVDTQAATIEVEIDGPAVVYASVVDNVSGDPIFVEAAALSKHWQVPIVASAEGANDTSWDTGLFVFNGDEEAATVHLALNRDGEAVVAYLQVEPAQTIHVGSLLSSMWGVEQGAGAVDIVSAARLAVNARISTSTPAGGTAGQRIPALAMDDPDPAGRTLAWIREDALYRTNIGLSNLSGQRAEVELRLRAADGSVVGSITQSVGRRRVVQKSLVQLFGDGAVADLGGPGWIDAVDVVPVSPPVVLYSSVVDNQSGDPVLDLAR
jgi:PKD repeat protein